MFDLAAAFVGAGLALTLGEGFRYLRVQIALRHRKPTGPIAPTPALKAIVSGAAHGIVCPLCSEAHHNYAVFTDGVSTCLGCKDLKLAVLNGKAPPAPPERGYTPVGQVPANLQPPPVGSAAVIPSPPPVGLPPPVRRARI